MKGFIEITLLKTTHIKDNNVELSIKFLFMKLFS